VTRIAAIAPVFNEEANLDELCRRLAENLARVSEDYEIILIDDGSADETWSLIQKNAAENPRVRGLHFSRNFGQHYALAAGLDAVNADWVVVLDGDLQDRPEVIPELYAKSQEGYDVVFVERQSRPESILYLVFQRLFFAILRWLSDIDFNPAYANYSIISRKVARELAGLRESSRGYSGLVSWLGFKRGSVKAEHGERFAGAPSYSLRRRIRLALDMIIAHSEKPLRLATVLGFIIAGLSFLYGLFIVFRALFGGASVEGWASLIVAVFFVGGILMILLGILGLYIGRIHSELKGRPLYIVSERAGFPEEQC